MSARLSQLWLQSWEISMRAHLSLAFAASVLVLAACQPADPAATPTETAEAAAPPELKLTCFGPFGPTTTGADLAKMFGAGNVVDESLPGTDGETLKITAIYPADPKRRVEITFANAKKRERLVRAEVKSMTSDWSGPEGIQTGESLAVVETANGGPFELQGFGWDYGGYVTDWKSGKIASPVQSCDPLMRFASDSADPAVAGEGSRLSSLPAMRASGAKVVSFSIGWDQAPPHSHEPEPEPPKG
jgi:hypothetical protein